jgi:flagellar biosynthesis protein FliQ
MTVDGAVEVLRHAFWITLVVGGPILVIGFIGGVLVSIVQILTSMQDPAFNTVPRLLLFLGSAMLLLPWMADRLLGYTKNLLGGLDRFAQ